MFDFYDLVLFSFLLIPIGRDLELSEGQEAVLLGVALGASGIGGILFGYLSDLYGRKRTLMWTVCLYSLGTGLTACASGFVTLFLFRLITGLGVGGEWAVGHALLAESTPKHFRGRGAALLQMGEPLGVALAAVTGLLLAPFLGWRLVFAISSASAIVAVVARSHLPESVVWERQREQSFSPRAAVKMIGELHLWGTLAKGWILGVFKLGTYWSCYVWLPKFLQDQMQQPVGRSALWILTSQLGQFLGMLAFGLVADKFGRRCAFTAYSLLHRGRPLPTGIPLAATVGAADLVLGEPVRAGARLGMHSRIRVLLSRTVSDPDSQLRDGNRLQLRPRSTIPGADRRRPLRRRLWPRGRPVRAIGAGAGHRDLGLDVARERPRDLALIATEVD